MSTVTQKRKRIVSYENMDAALKAAFEERYPHGFQDYFPEAVKFDKPDGTSFYAVTIETEDSIALVKVDVKTDAAEDIERWLDSEDSETNEEHGEAGEDALPDDNIAQYSNGEEDSPDQE